MREKREADRRQCGELRQSNYGRQTGKGVRKRKQRQIRCEIPLDERVDVGVMKAENRSKKRQKAQKMTINRDLRASSIFFLLPCSSLRLFNKLCVCLSHYSASFPPLCAGSTVVAIWQWFCRYSLSLSKGARPRERFV